MPDSLVRPLVLVAIVSAISIIILALIGVDGSSVTAWLSSLVGTAVGGILSIFVDLWKGLIEGVLTGLGHGITGIWGVITGAWSTIWNFVF